MKIKLGQYNDVVQQVTISINKDVVWEGNSGDVAEFELSEPAKVYINYAMQGATYGGALQEMIDPAKSANYIVDVSGGFFSIALALKAVESID